MDWWIILVGMSLQNIKESLFHKIIHHKRPWPSISGTHGGKTGKKEKENNCRWDARHCSTESKESFGVSHKTV